MPEKNKKGMVYLIPSFLHDEGIDAIPAYMLSAVKKCNDLFVENERTARRYLKKLSPQIRIEDFEWHTTHKAEKEVSHIFKQKLKEGKTIGIISEAGCPGIADPGQMLVAAAQEMDVDVKPLVGPNSILLSLMASGLNGQQFRFVGYLPIENQQRNNRIKELEIESRKENTTQIFIETPYRNNQLLDSLLKICMPSTKLCIAVNLTAPNEKVKTMSIANWKKNKPDLAKQPAIFCLHA
jgi:16S rRNA (cytidine1402-2'-O)-methyltransferase